MRGGLIWRSARLDQLTDEDCERILGLGIRLVADLRSAAERSQWPTKPALLQRVRHLCWDTPIDSEIPPAEQSALHALVEREGDPERVQQRLIDRYARIPDAYATQFGQLFDEIASAETPILIHCSAGKDRTGVAVALLLDLIGVDRSDILDNYALSEAMLDWSRLDVTATLGAGAAASTVLPPMVRDLLLRSDRRYLQATFDYLDRRYASTEGYLRSVGVSRAVMAAISGRLAED